MVNRIRGHQQSWCWPMIGTWVIVLLASTVPSGLLARDEEQQAQELVQQTCAACHRFEGKAESRFNLKAPDLMWGGSKFQREWLISWLTGKEETMYRKSYRWDQSQHPEPHLTVSQSQAEGIADYFEKNLQDPRVKENAIDMSTFSVMEASFGEQIFKEHACIGCHQIEGKRKEGGGGRRAPLS